MQLPQIEGSAPADSPLGLLQRGRGDGWLKAARSGDGRDHLIQCLQVEPRWDRQAESRQGYYVSLAIRLNLPARTLWPLLVSEDPAWIVFDVLDGLALRGVPEAREMAAQVQERGLDPFADPAEAVAHRAPKKPEVPSSDAPIEELLAIQGRYRNVAVSRLASTTDNREIAILRATAQDSTHPGWRNALRVLALRGELAPLHAAEQVLSHGEIGQRRAGALDYFRHLPPAASLPIARDWLLLDDARADAASDVLAAHAEPRDLALVRGALARAADYYTVSDLVQALGRLPGHGPFPELEEIYRESAYAYARARAVDAMATTDPEFGAKWATECLWDCEESSREAGARHAPLGGAALARLRELAADPHEDPEVRLAAASRLE